MAQLVEHFIRNERVRGSSPRVGSKEKGRKQLIFSSFFVIRFQLCYYKTKSNHRLNYMKDGCLFTRQSDYISLIFLFLSPTLKAVGLLKYGSLPQKAVSGTRTDCSAG